MRVRDELKMTISAYQTLYKSSVAFGMRKQIQAEKGKDELEERIKVLDIRKKELLEKVTFNLSLTIVQKAELENKKKTIQLRIDERREKEIRRRNEEIQFLEFQNNNLKKFYLQVIEK